MAVSVDGIASEGAIYGYLRSATIGSVLALVFSLLACATSAGELTQLDPFAQATSGNKACPRAEPRLYTTEEAGAQAHARAERCTRCAMEGAGEPGGAYRRDPEINEAVRAAIAAEKRFADTSVW